MISLLMRFYDPLQGCITLDGRPIKDLNVEWLRSSIGIVSQEPVIFSGTIEDNLRMGKEDLTTEEMEAACRMANAEEFIKKLPKVSILMTMFGSNHFLFLGLQNSDRRRQYSTFRRSKTAVSDSTRFSEKSENPTFGRSKYFLVIH